MTRFRMMLLAVLFLTPFAVLVALGSYHLWVTDRLWVWWPLLGVFALVYLLAWLWSRRPNGPADVLSPPPDYWTDRDRVAWAKVEARAAATDELTPDRLATPDHYADLALRLAAEIGRVYSPDSDSPYDHLTLPEVLACVELAASDLNDLLQRYVPGVHLIRLGDAKTARTAYEWYKTGQTAYWAGAAVLDPISTGLRFLVARYGLGRLLGQIQGNLLRWFHAAFVRKLGHYLIELNSGRLKVGVKRYRELLAMGREPPTEPTAAGADRAGPGSGESRLAAGNLPPPSEPSHSDSGATTLDGGATTTGSRSPDPVARPCGSATDRSGSTTGEAAATPAGERRPITLAVLGLVKAGKSSLVNALLGSESAAVDRLPVPGGTCYRVTLPGGQPVTLRDTSGYGERLHDDDFAAALDAAREADLILLVTPATSPGRAADLDLLDRLAAWFAQRPDLRMPPVLVVVNQIDLLSPLAEWSPPYDWRSGTRPKERTIRECVGVVREQFGSRAAEVVPVCARCGEAFGIAEELVPAVVARLGPARAASLLKEFAARAAERRFGRVVDQVGNLVSAGLDALSGWLKKRSATEAPPTPADPSRDDSRP